MEKTYTKNGTKKDIELIKKYLKDRIDFLTTGKTIEI